MRNAIPSKIFLLDTLKGQLKNKLATKRQTMMRKLSSWQTWSGLSLMTTFAILGGCASAPKAVASQPPVEAPAAPAPEAVRAAALASLQRQGVQVIQLGEQLRIVLRSDYLFMPNSANVLDSAKPVLAQVAALIRTYTTESMQVAAYTDRQDAPDYAVALTTRQAQVVAKRLWQMGIDTRLLTAVGLGQANPVDWNSSVKGQSNNRRVEISFRFYPRLKVYE